MKYNVLLTGFHQASIDEMFKRTEDDFYCIYSSARELDLVRHIELFHPDIILMCLKSEPDTIISSMVEVKKECEKHNVVFAILGNDRECENFKQHARFVADLAVVKPCSTAHLVEVVGEYMEERERIAAEVMEEERQRLERVRQDIQNGVIPPAVQQEPAEEAVPEKKHILVVDDDANMLKLIKHYLEDTYDVATALNGKLAAKFLSRKHTDLILLDYEMPEGSGDDVLKAVRNFERTKDLPVLFLTGVSGPKKIQKVMAFKPQGYLLKPIDQQKLLEAVREQIG